MASNTLPKFQQTNTTDSDLNTVQLNLVRTLNPIFNTPTLGGNLLSNITLTAGVNTINHGLGRNLNGWQLVRQRAQANIWDTQDSNKMQNLTLLLNSSAPVVCDIYVF
jgi:hypothetical protein